MVRLTRAIDFAASLRYWRPDLSESENRELFGRFAKVPPTPEHCAQVIHALLSSALGGRRYGIRLRQDEDLWVDLVGEDAS